MADKVRVRFAPSPTGLLHLGGIRSALFNWLYAQKKHGVFILRFEDTDRERFVEAAATQIKDSLKWLGLEWSEGVDAGGDYAPYVQSERLDIYAEYAAKLVSSGAMYPCWCTAERLDGLRTEAQKSGTAFKYDRHCLDNPGDLSEPHVLRFKVPGGETVEWDDVVRGHLEFSSDELDDFVAMKSDGYPTYNFANVVDDHLMEITHVFRGDEFIPTTPKNLLVYKAFEWQPPLFVHLPQVLGTDKAKLSKRHGAKSVLEYRDDGYLPDAIINFLAALGWNEGEGSTKEIYSRPELIDAFSLERIQKSPAVFDPERLTWLNGVYIRSLELSELAKLSDSFWPSEANNATNEQKQQVLGLIQERLKYLAEIPELTDFFFADPDPKAISTLGKLEPHEAKRALNSSITVLDTVTFEHDALEHALRPLADELGVGTGKLFGTLRIAMTGHTAAPGLFETMVVLGKETVLARLRAAVAHLA